MKNIILSAIFLFVIFYVATFIFGPMNLFYEIWWLDIPTHILGGIAITSLTISLLKYFNLEINYKRIFISILIVAILWEIYEYLNYIFFGVEWGGVFDTIKDIFDGIFGATLAYFIYKKR